MINRISVNFDGVVGPTGLAGDGAFGFVVKENEKPIHQWSGHLPAEPLMKQEIAQYHALLETLSWLHLNKMTGNHVRLYCRNITIVNQVILRWVPKDEFVPLAMKAINLCRGFEDVALIAVPIGQVEDARKLAELVLKDRGIEFYNPSKPRDGV